MSGHYLGDLLFSEFGERGAGLIVTRAQPAAAALAHGLEHLAEEEGLKLRGGFLDALGAVDASG
ncbi:MAG: hypothetical protein HZB13_08085 [Acidobacteria bacterium]|nr:hypothetical protein [Acidobacteriota bacterium]